MYVVASESVTCEPIARKPTDDTKLSQSQTSGDSAVNTMVMRGTCSFSRSFEPVLAQLWISFYVRDNLQKPSLSVHRGYDHLG